MTNITIHGSSCECEIDLRMLQDHNSINTKIIKESTIMKMCHFHEMQVRNEYLKRVKKQHNNAEYLKLKEYLSDLSNEIINT